MAKKWIPMKVSEDTYGLLYAIRMRIEWNERGKDLEERERLSLDKTLNRALRSVRLEELEGWQDEGWDDPRGGDGRS